MDVPSLSRPPLGASIGEQAEVDDGAKKAQLLHRKEQAAARKAKKEAKEAAELQHEMEIETGGQHESGAIAEPGTTCRSTSDSIGANGLVDSSSSHAECL
jgi:hypothetical protein